MRSLARCTGALASVTFAVLIAVQIALPLSARADDGGAKALASKIARVTVFSDRAQVTRTAPVSLGETPAVFAFRRLPGWVDDGSVRVEVTPADVGRIVDVRVARDYLARATDAEFNKAQAAVDELAAQIAVLDDELKILDGQALQIESIKAFSAEKISRDTSTRDVSVTSYRQVLDFIGGALRDNARERREVLRKRGALAPEMAARQRKLDELKGLTQLEETTVYVTMMGTRRADATVALTYLLPGATWEPAHELRTVGTAPGSAEILSYATVTQTSGEDWDDVEIAFATQSSRDSIRIPELEALTLGEVPRATRVVQAQVSSFTRAQAAFEVQNRNWNKLVQKGSASVVLDEAYDNNVRVLQMVQSRSVQLFQQIQKRGTTAHFAGLGRQTIRGDGRSARVVIGRANLKATPRVVAAPEESLNAALTLQMVNSGAQPLLPGKVALYRDGAFLGMTDVEFIAEGETFAMFLSVADQVKLARVLDKKASSLVRKSRTRMQVAFLVTVENLGGSEITVNLADRIPVSEDKDIRVDQVELSPSATPESNGLVRWTLTLAPKEKRTLRVAYRIEYPPSLVFQTSPEGERRAPANAEPSARPANLREKILDLESSF